MNCQDKYIKYKNKYLNLKKKYISHGGQHDELCDKIKQIHEKYFTENNIKCIKENNTYKISIECEYSKMIELVTDNNIIIKINLDEKKYDILLFVRCGKMSGSITINKLKQIAHELYLLDVINHIELTDVSVFPLNGKCYLDNFHLIQIMITNQSWYNQKGFVSTKFENEQKNNNIACNRPLTYYTDLLNKTIISNLMTSSSETIKSLSSINSIREYTHALFEYIKTNIDESICTSNEYIAINHLADIIRRSIKYDRQLIYSFL